MANLQLWKNLSAIIVPLAIVFCLITAFYLLTPSKNDNRNELQFGKAWPLILPVVMLICLCLYFGNGSDEDDILQQHERVSGT